MSLFDAVKNLTGQLTANIGNEKNDIIDRLHGFTEGMKSGFKNVDVNVDNTIPGKRSPGVLANMIGNYETAGVENAYQFQHPVTGDLGRYQVSPPTLKSDAKIYLGKDISPEDFLKSPVLQDQFANNRIKRWMNDFGMTENEAIKRWNVGLKGDINSPKANEYYRRVVKE